MSPSSKSIPVRVPPTCQRTSTWSTANSSPRKPSRESSSRTSALLTVTCGGVAGLVFAAPSVSRWKYVTNPIATDAVTIPGSIHRLACDRFLVRWLVCAAIDRLLASSTSQPLELRIAEPNEPALLRGHRSATRVVYVATSRTSIAERKCLILWQSVHQAPG